ncbi:hypothetical protein M9H77_17508 [Catharanthus roseus]|uniref:Uncharacterized protein n=1 Tax=Catharanthus roseus TaxID=4058 RepID=A0ACC0B4R4_CATRO|nr:hypothetical protein M9H77_17508 [Catharanthus roseus]
MVKLVDKPILAEKRITQESLEQYNVMELLLGMGCVELTLFSKKYNKNLVKEFYANLTKEFGNPESPTYGQVYVRGHVIDLSPLNIAYYLSCPIFSDIEGTGLEEDADFDEVTKVLTGDAGAVLPETNMLNSNLMKMPYKALFRVFCGNWLPTTNITTILKERSHLLYVFATRRRINICIVIFRNILRQIDQKKASKTALLCPCLISEYLLCCRDLSLSSNSWVRALEPLVMPKIIAPGVVPPSPTLSTQGYTGLDKFTRQESSEKKQPSTKLASPSPLPPPSAEFSEVTTSLDLIIQQLSSVMATTFKCSKTYKILTISSPENYFRSKWEVSCYNF